MSQNLRSDECRAKGERLQARARPVRLRVDVRQSLRTGGRLPKRAFLRNGSWD
jgi:hypothetical protein